MPPQNPPHTRRMRGFEPAAGLLKDRLRTAGESRGFAVTRLLTQWAEIVGDDIAANAVPVKIGYGRGGLGATLTLLTTGARAPMLEMQKDRIRDRVNACYGYAAIARVMITQTAATGFAEGQVAFGAAPAAETTKPSAEAVQAATEAARPVHDPGLRAALEALGQNVLTRSGQRKG
ncbi:MAG: DUF721 domain-containing protein [Rhodobacteraceae bacterium]|nr:DUF721 domain-containing protein [Paracoccaceae bacterium]